MSLRFLLDTNVLSEPMRARPDDGVMEMLRRHEREVCTAAVVWSELLYGMNRMAEGPKRALIARYLDDVVARTLPILPYDQIAAAWQASERARLEKKGKTPPFVDSMIAATAKVHGLVLVTNNVADYTELDVEVARWHAPAAAAAKSAAPVVGKREPA